MSSNKWVDRFIHASLWSAATSYVFFALNFLGQILLARFLLPADFGLYAYVFALRDLMLIFLGFATTQSFLYTDANQDQFNANVIINFFGCLILVLIGLGGWLVFGVLGKPMFGVFFFFLTLAQALTMMSYVYLAPLEKELKYKTVSIQQGMAGVIAMIVAIIVAYISHSAWSLIWRDVLSGVFAFGLAYWVAPKKLQGKIDWLIVKKQFNFGLQTGVSRALELICYRFPDVIIQHFFGRVALGNFYQARYLSYLPMKLLTPFTQQVLFSFFTNVRENKQEMSKNLFWINYSVLIVTFPIVLAVYLWGDHFLVWLYGVKWATAGIYFRYFSLFILFGVLFNMLQSASYSLALQKYVSIAYVLGIVVFFMGLIIIPKPEYSALAFSFGFIMAYGYLVWMLKKHNLGFSLLTLYKAPILISVLMIGCSIYVGIISQIIIYIICMLLYGFVERKNLIRLWQRIIKRSVA